MWQYPTKSNPFNSPIPTGKTRPEIVYLIIMHRAPFNEVRNLAHDLCIVPCDEIPQQPHITREARHEMVWSLMSRGHHLMNLRKSCVQFAM